MPAQNNALSGGNNVPFWVGYFTIFYPLLHDLFLYDLQLTGDKGNKYPL
jgi:hypothetical protein